MAGFIGEGVDGPVRALTAAGEGATAAGNFAVPGNYLVPTGIQNVDALLFGSRWTPFQLTFNFPLPDFYSFEPNYFQNLGINPTSAFQATPELASAVRYILPNLFGAVTQLTFQETAPNTFPDMSVFIGTPVGPGTAVGGIPGYSGTGQAPGDVWFDGANPGNFSKPLVGDYSWLTAIHELGHALGLKHGHQDDYGFTSQALTADRDSMEFSVMTYRNYIGAPIDGYDNSAGSYAATLMMYDIYALQHLYGANYGWNAGNTTYTFDPATGAARIDGNAWLQSTANKIFLTVWDGGGVDTYDFSNYSTNQTIDLTPGGWSVMSTAQLAQLATGHSARGNVFNALLFGGNLQSAIENANGGSGNDRITGNQVANTLVGNGGNDTLNGGAGADRLVGGAGNDTYMVDNAGDVIVETAGNGTDTVLASVSYTLAPGVAVETLATTSAAGTAGIGLTGNDLANALTGNAGANILRGGLGNDRIDGGAGNDTASYAGTAAVAVNLGLTAAQNTVGAGTDTLISIENLLGGNGNDTLTGNAGANILTGGVGNDTLLGGLGNDRLDGGAGIDLASYAGGPAVSVSLATSAPQNTGAGTDTLIGIENLLGSIGNDRLTGNGAANVLLGGNGDDVLTGGLGTDVLSGGAGTDAAVYSGAAPVHVSLAVAVTQWTAGGGLDRLVSIENLFGSSGNDTLTGDGNANLLSGGAGADSLVGGGGNDALAGGLGRDLLTGGAGADRFLFTAAGETPLGGARDVIMDWTAGDRIDLSAMDANLLLPGNQAFVFIGVHGVNNTVSAGQLKYYEIAGKSYVAGGVNGDSVADFQIEVHAAGHHLVAADFVL